MHQQLDGTCEDTHVRVRSGRLDVSQRVVLTPALAVEIVDGCHFVWEVSQWHPIVNVLTVLGVDGEIVTGHDGHT